MSLITTLDSSVTDSSLLQIDELRFNVSVSSGTSNERKVAVSYSSDGPGKAKILGEGHFTDSTLSQDLGKEVSLIRGTNDLYLSTGTYQLSLPKKYDINLLNIGRESSPLGMLKLVGGSMKFSPIAIMNISPLVNADDTPLDLNQFNMQTLKELQIISDLVSYQVTGDISAFEGSSVIEAIRLGYSAITGDVESLEDLTTLKVVNINSSYNIEGNVSSLVKLVNLTSFAAYRSKLTGTVESFLDGLYANGKVSGDLVFNFGLTSVTYNGSTLSGQKTATFSAGGWSVA